LPLGMALKLVEGDIKIKLAGCTISRPRPIEPLKEYQEETSFK